MNTAVNTLNTLNAPLQAEQGMASLSVRTEPVDVPGLASPLRQAQDGPSPARTGAGGRVILPAKGPLLTRTGWSAFIIALIVVCALAPVLNLWVPEGSMFHMSTYAVALLGKIMCYAICALAMDLIWGYTGILSLGHGLLLVRCR